MNKRFVFPFPAIVGQEKAKLALLVNAVNPLIGGVLLRGDKGTGKTTMVRALADILPEIKVVSNCPFNCDPENPQLMCDSCLEKYMRGEELPVSIRRMKVVDLPLSITVDRLVGTLDFEKAIKEGIRALKPGLLAEANRNILYIDEVNLLDDYVVDVLLDVVAYGWNIIEREGISIKHPCRVILVGSMNPEEGELRPQILDRFGLVVNVEAPMDSETRMEVVKRVEEFWQDPEKFYKKYESEINDLRNRITKARQLLPKVEIDDDLLKTLSETIIKLKIKTHRAEIVTVRTAKAIAALDGRVKVSLEDLKKAMELSLPHRIKAKPFEKTQIQISETINNNEQLSGKEKFREQVESYKCVHEDLRRVLNEKSINTSSSREMKFKTEHIDIMINFSRCLSRGSDILVMRCSKDARKTIINYPQGFPITYITPRKVDLIVDLDIHATLLQAATRQSTLPIRISFEDLKVRVRRIRIPKVNIILLDSSGSMAIKRRISIAKGLVAKIIEESYIRRNYVSLVIFKDKNADMVVELSRNYEQILDLLDKIPTGGKTPLSHALQLTLNFIDKLKTKFKDGIDVWCYIISDGKANVPLGLAESIHEELSMFLQQFKKMNIKLIVYDTRPTDIIDPSISYIELFREFEYPIYRIT